MPHLDSTTLSLLSPNLSVTDNFFTFSKSFSIFTFLTSNGCQRIRHMEDSPQKICHKEDSPHSRVGGLVREVGEGWGQGVGSYVSPVVTRQLPRPQPTQPPPPPPDLNLLTPTLPTQPITIVWRIFHIVVVANVCPTLTLKFSVTFVCLTRCVANLPCGESLATLRTLD